MLGPLLVVFFYIYDEYRDWFYWATIFERQTSGVACGKAFLFCDQISSLSDYISVPVILVLWGQRPGVS